MRETPEAPRRSQAPTQSAPIEGEGGVTEAGWHSIESAFRCLKEYQFASVRGLHTPLAQTPDHFAVGSLFHAGRARWFARSFDTSPKTLASIKEAISHEGERLQLPVSLNAERRVLDIMSQYIAHWSKRQLPRPLATEYKLGPAPVSPGDPFPLWRTARPDDISVYPEAPDFLCIGEGKTTSTDISTTINQYTLHGQPLMMAALYKLAPQGEAKFGPIKGIMLDIVKKPYGKDKAKFARQFVPISQTSLAWFVRDLRQMIRFVARIDWDTEVPRNISSCTRMVGRGRMPCQYRDLCMHGRAAAIKFVLKDGRGLGTFVPTAERKKMPWE